MRGSEFTALRQDVQNQRLEQKYSATILEWYNRSTWLRQDVARQEALVRSPATRWNRMGSHGK